MSVLKSVDRSELTKDKYDHKMIKIILIMAKTFDLKVVAEGVETIEQYQLLADNNCDMLQGYLYSKPLSKDDFEEYYYQA
ncbi:MAG: EAL domain-containing protein [gamma proteobacterium symbiont of Lucinoma myriamae]|nr:EAL domain-containing protein [gamma proteobacterium symbiont of Lucinoma myriamae]